ncbi:hypothetical protein EJ02DRAFT_367925 [Clathrospora elynae]|uniref:Uncharacterized protein n=1 Tax=Clathrospora elynae TaxID=706981 RepID=A0A6A5T0N1_9PLEO|nr:hypothetical protein EJ02DRAFT_367925 [Clathrospora elynae]
MSPPLSTQDDNAAFLEGCINKTRSVRDVYESLGLFSQTSDVRKDPDFLKNEANELSGRIKQIAKTFVLAYRGDPEQLQTDLAEETVFSNDLLELGRQYGATIWGRLEDGEILSSGTSQERGLDELDWDRQRDRNTIQFYLRCWIVSVAVREVRATPRKRNGRGRQMGVPADNHNGVEYLSDSSGGLDMPFRAPEPPRMFPTPEPRGQAALSNSASRGPESAAAPRFTETTTPCKRKAPSLHEQTPNGKLPKPSKAVRTIPVPFREQRRDMYSILRSPTAPLNLGRSLLENQRQRESTHGADTTWVPREATAETETVVDGDEVAPEELDSILQSAVAMASEDGMEYGYQAQPTAGPSGTYVNPLSQDSVIPNDTQTQIRRTDAEPTEDHAVTSMDRVGGALNDAIRRSFISHNSDAACWQQREYRRELFKLLLSYLNGIHQFSADSYDFDAEERMNFLLNQFWVSDTEALQNTLGDDFVRLHIALGSWMSMRHRLGEFRNGTGYFGRPGEGWAEYLRCMEDVPRANVMLAYVDLQDLAGKGDASRYVSDTFDDDLAMVFDVLTRVKGCLGAEAFVCVRRYNEALLEWFKDSDL